MRLDKYLKVSRLIKRRTVANEACDAGRVMINGKTAKAGTDAGGEVYVYGRTACGEASQTDNAESVDDSGDGGFGCDRL